MAPITEEEYVKNPACPHCGSTDLLFSSDVIFNGDFIAQRVTCEACGKEHEAIYDLSGYEKQP
jgi:transposase-like protein